MNLPDITLFFQMIHFAVAYVVLRRFVFAPALIIIETNEERMGQLQKRVDMARSDHQGLQEQQRQRWRFIQQSLSAMIPKFNDKSCLNSAKLSTPVQLDGVTLPEEQRQSIKKMLHDELLDAGR